MAANTYENLITLELLEAFKGYLETVMDDKDTASAASSKLTMTENGANGNYANSYTFKQGNTTLGTINLLKDMVVTGGEVVTLTAGQVENLEAGIYIHLTIANSENTDLYIPASALVDEYSAEANAAQVQLTITGRTISGAIVAGSIGTTEIANKSITKAKTDDGVQASLDKADTAVQGGANTTTVNITKEGTNLKADVNAGSIGSTQLAESVNTALGKANTAVQSVEETAASGNDGTVTVDGNEVAVKGYGTLASKVSTLESNSAAITIATAEQIQAMFTPASGEGGND